MMEIVWGVMAALLIVNRLKSGTFAKNGVNHAKSSVVTVLLMSLIRSE